MGGSKDAPQQRALWGILPIAKKTACMMRPLVKILWSLVYLEKSFTWHQTFYYKKSVFNWSTSTVWSKPLWHAVHSAFMMSVNRYVREKNTVFILLFRLIASWCFVCTWSCRWTWYHSWSIDVIIDRKMLLCVWCGVRQLQTPIRPVKMPTLQLVQDSH